MNGQGSSSGSRLRANLLRATGLRSLRSGDSTLLRTRDHLSRVARHLKRLSRYNHDSITESLETTVGILRAQQEATLDGILVVDRDGGVMTFNSRFLEIWGIPQEVAAKGNDSELLAYAFGLVAYPEAFSEEVRKIYEHPLEIRDDDIIPLRDGRILSRASVPVRASDGSVTGRAWYFRDVSEHIRADQLRSALFRISEIAHTAGRLEDVYHSIHGIVGELMDATNFYIALYDHDTDLLSFPYYVDEFDPQPTAAQRSDRGLTSYVIRTGKPLLASPSRFEELVRSGEVESIGAPSVDWLGVPLVSRTGLIGVLGVQSYTESVRYGEKEMEILTFVSHHVASAIDHKRKSEELRRAKEYSESLINAANALIVHLDAAGAVNMLNDKAEELTGCSLADAKGKKFFDLFVDPTESLPLWSSQSSLPPLIETSIRTSAGEGRQISWHNSEIQSEGRAVGTVCIGIDVTEQRIAEQAILESQDRYRQMFDNNPAVKLLVDPQTGNIEHANRAACEFYGYTLAQLTSMKMWDLGVAGERAARDEMFRAVSRQGWVYEQQQRIATGEVRDVVVHSGPVLAAGTTLLYSIITDVTDRKRAEQALAESEEKYRNIFRFATVCIYQSTSDGTIVTANESMARMLGYGSVDELLSRNMNTDIYVNPEDRDELLRRYADGRSHADVEVVWKRKDGSPIWVQLNAHAVRDRVTGETLYYEGFAHDVSERKLAEEMMRNQSAAFRASMDGIAILNDHLEFIYVNDAYAELFGYASTTELIGRSWEMVYEEHEYARVVEEVLPQVARVGSWRGEADGLRRDGRMFPQEISLTPLDSGGMVCVARDTTERNVAEEQIRHLAYHDILTGLPNRLLFKDRLTVAISRAQRDHSKLAVLFLDLDDFKRVNDSLGHNIGDHLLQAVATRIHGCVRESDTVARLGGDEFTVLLPYLANAEDAAPIARKLLEAIRRPFNIQGANDLFVTTSIGISVFPDDGLDTETLIKNADTAMYQAKNTGRDNYQLFNASISAHALERLALENGLRRAIERDEFRVHYQPIYDVATGRIFAMEALARWQHPDLGLLPPANFIPLAESLNLMGQIGIMVLRAACKQFRAWQRLGFGDMTLSINISLSQLRQADCVERVAEVLRETELPRGSLELEITESGAMLDPESTIKTLHALKALGVRISLDDFGTGHSSLSHLKRFPIDTLKIDQSFVRDITEDSDTAGIVTAIIAMARTLKLGVIAEGVEREEQRAFLLENGCHLMQGFLLKRPVGPEEFTALLAG